MKDNLIRVIILSTILIIFSFVVFGFQKSADSRVGYICNNCSYDVAEKPSYLDKIFDPVSVLTLFLVVSTFLLWRSTERLANLAAGQSKDMRDSINEAARAADEMAKVALGIEKTGETNKTVLENQREFWQMQMRAYVSIDHGQYVRQNPRLRFEFRPNIINNGQTPASNVQIFSICDIKERIDLRDFDFSIPYKTSLSSATIAPRQGKYISTVFTRKATCSEMRRLLEGNNVFHLWGRIRYRDSFNKDRTTNFSFFITLPRNKRGQAVWHATDEHNDTT